MDSILPQEENSSYADLKKTRRRRMSLADPMHKIDRLPPNSQEAECGVLGCLLLNPEDCMREAIDLIKTPEIFYDLRHRELWKNMLDMHGNDIPIDTVLLCTWLKDKQMLEAVGGMAYIASLPDSVPSASNLSYYVEILNEKYQRRKMIIACTDAVASIYDKEDEPISRIKEYLEHSLNGEHKVIGGRKTARELVHQAINLIEEIHQNKGRLLGPGSGLHDLDQLLQGFRKKDLIVIAARPSVGKTSIAMTIVSHVAIEDRQPVAVFSLEMSGLSLMTRLICARAHVNLRNIRDGFLAERDFPKITGAAGKIANAPIEIDDTGGLTVAQIRSRSKQMVEECGVVLIIIDQLSKVQSGINGLPRQREVAIIISALKDMAKELDVPVIVLHQINRGPEKEKNRVPSLGDLRESGEIEAEADVVILLHKPDKEEEEGPEARSIDAIVAKQRDGPTGVAHLMFLKCFTKFESAAKVSDDDIPYLPAQEHQQAKVPYSDL